MSLTLCCFSAVGCLSTTSVHSLPLESCLLHPLQTEKSASSVTFFLSTIAFGAPRLWESLLPLLTSHLVGIFPDMVVLQLPLLFLLKGSTWVVVGGRHLWIQQGLED